ncbi:MAG: hypothetical protein PHX07_03270 [Candidatus Marinimicrobia bacterium]|jgi:hypothetical protein|nr:hypothetical protein [Candidatus Neomarinimicrobiota bacterium]MDD4961239.1 hypothetical protein [Candidatus Neomarinimicrobiota bacterium]MDD5709385.1 hypothetical protein [Candidatus Neomarinimicrobiota bacterium]MDX9777245.1 hypothetical protein [bacterium]
MKEIVRIDSRQSAKIIAITGFFIMLIFGLIGLILLLTGLASDSAYTLYMGLAYLLLPFLYLPLGYFLLRFYFWIYNQCAARWGGIRIEFKDKEMQ